jgi:23S rRNA pseudouridine1911/1915/1917 synthase
MEQYNEYGCSDSDRLMSAKFQTHAIELPASARGLRLDQALAAQWPQYSRARIQRWIRAGALTVGGAAARPRDAVFGGEQVQLKADFAPDRPVQPQALPLAILYEDPAIIVINKPAGLTVHPGAGQPDGTLQNALLAHDPALAQVPRAGIVHRLDKDTSGVLVIARTPQAHTALVAALQQRQVGREYLAVCVGAPTAGGRIEAPIGRHRTARTRMAVRGDGRRAVTHYRVKERFGAHTLLKIELETGRTHQIRVHLAHVGLPIAGDPVYGGRRQGGNAARADFARQALHARRLTLIHPTTHRRRVFVAPLPEDLRRLIAKLRAAHRSAA